METTFRKTSTRIWTPLLEKFTERLDDACLRRDAYLGRILESELDALDAEVTTPNSDAARSFIAAHLDALPRKLVTLTLPEPLMQRIDDLCERKQIVRDSFFNRLVFMLAAEPRVLDRLWFDGDRGWFPHLLGESSFKQEAAARMLDPIQADLDPFWAYREGMLAWYDGNPPFGIYTAVLDDTTFPKVDLFGLNIHLPDRRVPGTAEHQHIATLLDDLLTDDAPTPESAP